jgi:hypothetical protein
MKVMSNFYLLDFTALARRPRVHGPPPIITTSTTNFVGLEL